MKINTARLDVLSIGLSTLCVVHCLAMPLAVALLPSISLFNLGGEAFHLAMLVMVIPLSLLALTLGCRKHERRQLLVFGAIGVALLILAVSVGHHALGEMGEKSLTILGALTLAFAHFRNFQLCQGQKCSK